MKRQQLLGLAGLVLVLTGVAWLAYNLVAGARDSMPNPRLAPAEVVRRQLDALQHNDEPTTDHGIAVAYRFASPDKKARSGSLAHFAAIVHAHYPDILDFNDAVYLPLVHHGPVVMQPVILSTDVGPVWYVFVLSRQHGDPCPHCWMTDAIIRLTSMPDGARPI